jgi:hypothetical protein
MASIMENGLGCQMFNPMILTTNPVILTTPSFWVFSYRFNGN